MPNAYAGLELESIVPFVILLVGIAILPLLLPHWWESNRHKLFFALLCGLPVAAYMWQYARSHGIPFTLEEHPVLSALHEYVAFMLLLLALFVTAGGVHVRGTLAGTPLVNTAFLAVGAVLASLVGTTGASMLLIRPLLRANRLRKKKTHVIVFFIFVVSNCGGLLTPLGDPPLFLGFLRGVPFVWTLQLWKEWLLVNGGLLIVFQFLDTHFFHREEVEEKADLDVELEEARTRFGIEGGANLLLLLAVMGAVWLSHELAWPAGAQEAAMAGVAVLSLAITKRTIRDRNHFTWGPIVEVAVLFLGIFLAMIPALRILNARSAELGIDTPREFFWATGALSSFLDNAPTYLTFAAVASGLHGVAPEGRYLGQFLASGPSAGLLLAAISCGAVMMGANTYIGNGPNFMVKAIAEKAGVRMPGFFGYMGWSCAVLIPLFAIVTIVSF